MNTSGKDSYQLNGIKKCWKVSILFFLKRAYILKSLSYDTINMHVYNFYLFIYFYFICLSVLPAQRPRFDCCSASHSCFSGRDLAT